MKSKPAAECGTMAEIRAEIDRVDRHLVRLMAERQTYIKRAAEIKPTRAVVRDEARIADVVEKVLAEAAKAGLSAEVAEPVWRLMVERFIALELAAFDERQR